MSLFDRIKKAFTGEDPNLPKQEAEEKEIVFEKYEEGTEKTRKSFTERFQDLFASFREVDEEFFEDLEETFIMSDIGFDMTLALSDAVRDEIQKRNPRNGEEVKNIVVEKLVEIYEKGSQQSNDLVKAEEGPTVYLFVGVNGVGKTTTVGKLAHQLKNDGHKVLLAAADTFRAGAIEQLEEWGRRIDVPVVVGKKEGDPAAVAFEAVDRAKKEGYDYVLVDTAGRLQTKEHLMKELEKIKRIISRELPGAPHEVILVVDATTGQNALVQAKQFNQVTDISGIALTKLDGTAKGGVVFAIRHEMDIPVKLIGLGEGVDDLQAFDSEQFIYQLIKDVVEVKA